MGSDVRVRRVEGRRDVHAFVDLPVRLHRGAPGFVAPLRMAELETLDPKKNPFFEHSTMQLFLAERQGEPVGRIALIDNRRHNELHDDDLAFFGFFEATDEAVAHALLDRVVEGARELGRRSIRGPANPSMNDSAGLQVDAFESPPYIMMPWNPAVYPVWVERHGFAPIKDLLALVAEEANGIPDRFERLATRARERSGVVVREVNLRDWDRELAHVQRIYTEAWEANWGEVAYTDAEFAALADTLKLVLDPAVALLAEIGDDVVGVALGLPDLNQVLARFDGRIVPFGIVPLLRRRAIIDQIRLAILGVLPAYRNRGLELVLIDEVWRRGVAAGYHRAELSWILEDNEAILKGIRAVGGRETKRYRMYQKEL